MGCGVYWQKIRAYDLTLRELERAGLGPGTEGYNAIYALRGKAYGQMGRKFPRVITKLTRFEVALRLEEIGDIYISASPEFSAEELKDALVRIWYDDEERWMAEARLKPSSPPMYRSITTEVAASFLKGEPSSHQIAVLMTPDPYLGE